MRQLEALGGGATINFGRERRTAPEGKPTITLTHKTLSPIPTALHMLQMRQMIDPGIINRNMNCNRSSYLLLLILIPGVPPPGFGEAQGRLLNLSYSYNLSEHIVTEAE